MNIISYTMGKIKPKLVRKSANVLLNSGIEFSENFKENKKILGDSMPGKKIRNQMAGLLSKLKKQQKQQ
ncbi:MAG TPA: hypothetical protein VMZ91_09215 [Candidatus Paceibacterota bacterium]|nr:hypothetical protein [Candidatus Paceibacterota bacterium]